MALRKQLNFTGVAEVLTAHGVLNQGDTTVSLNAYIKVEEVKASKAEAIAVVSITDGDKRLMMTTPFTASVEDGAKNIIAQAYNALKQMPLFVGAKDC
jgi:hypothetical protein